MYFRRKACFFFEYRSSYVQYQYFLFYTVYGQMILLVKTRLTWHPQIYQKHICYWLSERSVQEDTARSSSFFAFFGPSRRQGPQTSEKRTRFAVSSGTDRTSSVNKLFIIWQKQKQFAVTSRISSMFVCLNLFHVVLKHYLLPDNKKHLDSPHSQTFQTLSRFTKQNFLKRYKLKLVKDFPAKPERSILLVSDRSGANQNALFWWMDRAERPAI